MNSTRKKRLGLIFVVMLMMFAYAGMPVFAATDEMEPNDDSLKANTIKMGTTVYGMISDSYEEDWFKFKAPISGTAKITVHADGGEYSDSYVTLYAYDANMGQLDYMSDSLNDEKGETITFGVTYGKTYYVKCYSYWDLDYHFNVAYSIGKTSITSTARKTKGFTVKWNKKSKASFYQVQYVKKSTYQDYGWSKAKTLKVSKDSNKKTISKLSKNKTYYVRVRVARTISGKTYYSKWSARKAIKTK